MGYDDSFIQIWQTEEYLAWLLGLRDRKARMRVENRIDRLRCGNPGDVAPVGEGVSELRIHHGPGYRVYYMQRGSEVVILAGGDKSTQQKDIKLASALARQFLELK